MKRNTQVPDLPPLSSLERDVMRVLWDRGDVAADDVRQVLPRALKDATVRTVLRRLEEKGYVSHTVDGRSFVYHAVHQREAIAGSILRQFADAFFGNSVSALLVGLVETDALSAKDLQTAIQKVEAARAQSARNDDRA
jgi:BlaI family transcriptional regulator, penicillinase repressor